MRFVGSYSGSVYVKELRIASTVIKGQLVIEDGATGEIKDPTGATDGANAVGVTLEAGTVSTTQGTGESTADVKVAVALAAPGHRFSARISPDSTSGTAYADGDGSFLTNTTASAGGTVVTDADVTDSHTYVGGTLIALSGGNAGQRRIVSADDNTSVTVTAPFDLTIAVDDTFLFVPYAVMGTLNVQMTGTFDEADGSINVGTGAAALIHDIHVTTEQPASLSAPEASVEFEFADSVLRVNT